MRIYTYLYIETYVFILMLRKYNINNVNHRRDNSNSNEQSDHTALKKSYLLYVRFTHSAWTFKGYTIPYF